MDESCFMILLLYYKYSLFTKKRPDKFETYQVLYNNSLRSLATLGMTINGDDRQVHAHDRVPALLPLPDEHLLL
jgi:hypothetical protein